MQALDPTGQLSLDLLALVLGLCTGSFLNVLSLRSLSGESPLWPLSKCPKCQHSLNVLENIPLVSYMILRGRCRHCQDSISWQYPLVEAFTAISFVALERVFYCGQLPFNQAYWQSIATAMGGTARVSEPINAISQVVQADLYYQHLDDPIKLLYLAGMLFFACTLIAITVTDFKEKLIPHEITYPSMLIGIAFSAIVRQDVLGAMAGIGASYILFDFLAFYGLKVYMRMHGGSEDEPPADKILLDEEADISLPVDSGEEHQPEEPIEVMGGGDAVLAAVMSAYLGWQLLIVALVIGFAIGTIMGLALLVVEMKKAKLLHKAARHTLLGTLGLGGVFALAGWLIFQQLPIENPVGPLISLAMLGGIGGALLGVVSVGTQVSKPYPFGPALAAGGFIAMFFLPNWLTFH